MRIKIRFYFGHVRTYPWLHKLRNTQGKIYWTYLGNIYGIYTEYIWNMHKYSRYKIIRKNTPNGAPPKAAPVLLIILYHKYLWIFLIYSLYIPYTHIFMYIYIYIYILAMFHIFSLVCFWIYGVKSRSGHDRSQSFG